MTWVIVVITIEKWDEDCLRCRMQYERLARCPMRTSGDCCWPMPTPICSSLWPDERPRPSNVCVATRRPGDSDRRSRVPLCTWTFESRRWRMPRAHTVRLPGARSPNGARDAHKCAQMAARRSWASAFRRCALALIFAAEKRPVDWNCCAAVVVVVVDC